jgi:hypothetical protein
MASPLTMSAFPHALPSGLRAVSQRRARWLTLQCVFCPINSAFPHCQSDEASDAPLPLPEPSLQTLQRVPAQASFWV